MSARMSDRGESQGPQQLVVLGPDPLVGREVGGYVIEVPLGEGGMGLVYQARHPFLGRRFAIKVLRPELATDKQLSANFVREAQTLSGLKHPHIIDIVGFGPLDDQRQFMVMEFLDGRTLEAELHEYGALPLHRALSLAEEILDGLEAAHSIDVIHRDLKPSNVFLAKVSGGKQVVKLLDFGLAKLAPAALAGDKNSAASARSAIAGTPDYIAPEQAIGEGVSKLSDLYSFGVMFYEVLTGKKLFAADEASLDPIHELLQQHLHKRAPRLGEAFPADLDLLVSELLEKDPKNRPQGVQYVRQRLRRLTRDMQRELTQQRPNPMLLQTAEILPRLASPPRAMRWPVVVAALVLLAGAATAWWAAGEPEQPVVVAAAPPVVVAPKPEELEPLARLPPVPKIEVPKIEVQKIEVEKRDPLPEPAPAPKKVSAALPECEVNDRWRTAVRGHLQELQQRAASKGTAAAWTRFEDAEGPLTASIASAESGVDCAAVERRIQQLAKELAR